MNSIKFQGQTYTEGEIYNNRQISVIMNRYQDDGNTKIYYYETRNGRIIPGKSGTCTVRTFHRGAVRVK